MKIRTGSISLLMALFAAFCLSAVAMADSDTAPVSATLVDDLCGFDISATKGDLGTWTYDGKTGQYALTSSTSMVVITGDLLNVPMAGCDLTVTFTGLTGPGGAIDTTHFSAHDDSGAVGPGSWLVAGMTSPTYTFDLTLDSVPSIIAGEYTGQVDVTVARAA